MNQNQIANLNRIIDVIKSNKFTINGDERYLTAKEANFAASLAFAESGMRPDVKGTSKSESGLYQYTDDTWESKFDKKYCISESDWMTSKNNLELQTKVFLDDMVNYTNQFYVLSAEGPAAEKLLRDEGIRKAWTRMGEIGIPLTTENYINMRHNVSPSEVIMKDFRRLLDGTYDEIEQITEARYGQQITDNYDNPSLSPLIQSLAKVINLDISCMTNQEALGYVKAFYNNPNKISPKDKTNLLKTLSRSKTLPKIDIGVDTCKQVLASAQTTRRVDPLILDLDGDGVETTNVKDGAYFDHDGNGFAEQTGWVSSDDGLLVMDRNNNGTIDNGKEIFGDQTILQNGQRATDGFQALAELDSNSDGVIDVNDTAFSNLRIWQDVDGDGYSAADELFTLQEVGIQSINVAHTDTNTLDPQGNTQIQAGTFTKTDGSTASIGGFNLQRDVTYSIATEWLDIPDNIAALPDLQGYGNTYDLHQTMTRERQGANGEGLKGLIEQFIASEDPAVRDNLIEQILFKWTGSDTIDPASRGGNFDARKPQSHYLSQSPQR